MRQCVYDVGDSRTPHGVRGLKLNEFLFFLIIAGRTPHGVRGLKHPRRIHVRRMEQSHPSRGAWIETGKIRMKAAS